MKHIPASRQPIHPSIARFLGRFGRVVESWDGGFNIQKRTLNGHAFYAYRYALDPDNPNPYILRVSFGSHLMLQRSEFRGYLMSASAPSPELLDFDAAASAYEVALYLSGNLPVAAPMPAQIQRGVPTTSDLSHFALLDYLVTHGYDVGHLVYDEGPPPRSCVVVQGDIKHARAAITGVFGPPWLSTPAINSRNVVIAI